MAALITEAYEAWDELWADLGESHLDPRGFICVSREQGDEAEEYRDGLEAGGYPFEIFEPGAAVKRWPFLEPGTFRYAFFSPEGGALHCRKIAAGLAAWLRARRERSTRTARSRRSTPTAAASSWNPAKRCRPTSVIVTAGAWVLKLFPELRGELKTYRTALAYVEPPADLKAAWEAAPVILDVGGKTDGYMIPPSGGAGMKFGSGLHKVPTSDADWNRDPVEGEGEAIRDLFSPPIARIGEYRVTEVVTCAYTFTDDERFFATRRANACRFGLFGPRLQIWRGGWPARRRGGRRRDMDGLKRWLRAEVYGLRNRQRVQDDA